jgi:hypothetical protein
MLERVRETERILADIIAAIRLKHEKLKEQKQLLKAERDRLKRLEELRSDAIRQASCTSKEVSALRAEIRSLEKPQTVQPAISTTKSSTPAPIPLTHRFPSSQSKPMKRKAAYESDTDEDDNPPSKKMASEGSDFTSGEAAQDEGGQSTTDV